MVKEYHIEPVTRLEGHAGMVIVIDNNGKVDDVQFNVQSTRFFEKFCEGRLVEHLPRITPRICGICPIPHHISCVKAVEDAWGIKIPTPAFKLRELLVNAKQYASHVLHFYALASPDFLLGPFADPSTRNVVNVINKMPDVGVMALKMMDFGQKLGAAIGGKSVHPVIGVPGGMRKALDEDDRDLFLKQIDEQIEFTKKTADIALKVIEDYWDVVSKVGEVPTYYIGLTKNGVHELYDGDLRVVTPDGKKIDYNVHKYLDVIAERVLDHSYTPAGYYKPAGYPEGIFRANTLAMINAVDKMGTPLADEALKTFRSRLGNISHHTFAFHWARIIETIASIETIKKYLEDPDVVNPDQKIADVEPREGEGIACIEAPRGILLYHINSDDKGICKKINIIVSTNLNVGGIEKSLKYTAKQIIEDNALNNIKLPEPWLK